jgi:hypothetical protein
MADLFRAHAQVIERYPDGRARVWIPAMERDHDVHVVASIILPRWAGPGDRFFLRTTLDYEDFRLAPEVDQGTLPESAHG